MKNAIIVGSGAGGATVAKELQGKFNVTILEAGGEFHPFAGNLSVIEKLRKTGLFFDERLIQFLFPTMKIRKTTDKVVLVNGLGTGGTTTISTANAVRKDHDLQKIGINLDSEYKELVLHEQIAAKQKSAECPEGCSYQIEGKKLVLLLPLPVYYNYQE